MNALGKPEDRLKIRAVPIKLMGMNLKFALFDVENKSFSVSECYKNA